MSNNPFQPLSAAARPSLSTGEPSSTPAPTSHPANQSPRPTPKKRKGHRGGKKKRSRRKSFALIDDDGHEELEGTPSETFYRLPEENLSGTSIDSELLLDHRSHPQMRARRSSTAPIAPASKQNASVGASRLRTMTAYNVEDDHLSAGWNENTPLLSDSAKRSQGGGSNYASWDNRSSRPVSHRESSVSSKTRLTTAFGAKGNNYDVNNPPSMPASPEYGPVDTVDMAFGDVMIRDELDIRESTPRHLLDDDDAHSESHGSSPRRSEHARLNPSDAAGDVCFPAPGMSEMGEEDAHSRERGAHIYRTRRRRGQWPDLSNLEEWSHLEKEGRSEERRVKKITEPQLINGRLRPVRKGWFQTEEEAPFRFTYFNEEFQSTIHSQTISELVQPGTGFRELFIPDPPILSDDESEIEETPVPLPGKVPPRQQASTGEMDSKTSTRQPSLADATPRQESSASRDSTHGASRSDSGRATPIGIKSPEGDAKRTSQQPENTPPEKPIRYGDRPIWWLDVMCPTEPEMKVLSKTFGIHPLTAEDIMLQEAREKVELFRHYYFVNYRTFDQDNKSENYLEPVNMYVVVFREGVLSFHFSVTPHPANVRRRIRQLKDYLILSSDWISYAIIDDITDVFQPLIQTIEDEVDEIDETILQWHSSADTRLKDGQMPPPKNDDASTIADTTSDMLRRVGDCRKRVMSLYRLLGNKADVIKGFAKRCNERWEVAPRSEIGLYLGDIQDHIVTMTSNLSHYEKILARSHGNYLAQINLRMNERQEQTADVLGKLTVLGTIVLPMNIITGLWGMNVWVPGQEYENDLTWFVWITAGLLFFGLACYMIAKRVYNIV
ncbi:hypothetical protein B0I35DRAFT_507261 [Stachybotrys elegans]|uniref:Uncharacterized protein n=1 Tax=Stachybotrys elegans TaxID=80388 RepID=A0A8K0WYG6_9HYPO|nr:hypothetical protein B0I35DRAFT_507261 [Stachybotrys elegans]